MFCCHFDYTNSTERNDDEFMYRLTVTSTNDKLFIREFSTVTRQAIYVKRNIEVNSHNNVAVEKQ